MLMVIQSIKCSSFTKMYHDNTVIIFFPPGRWSAAAAAAAAAAGAAAPLHCVYCEVHTIIKLLFPALH